MWFALRSYICHTSVSHFLRRDIEKQTYSEMRCYINRRYDSPRLEVAQPHRLQQVEPPAAVQPVVEVHLLLLPVGASVDWPHCGLPRMHSNLLSQFDVIVM